MLKLRIILLSIILILFSNLALAFNGTGTGTSANPFQVTNWSNLNNMRMNLTAFYVLNNSLYNSDADYTGIGNDWYPVGNATIVFSGGFDGQGYTINDMKITRTNQYLGMFGYLFGNVKNLILNNLYVYNISTSNSRVGGIAGYMTGYNITNCTVIGNITGNMNVGGIIGYTGSGNIINTLFNGNVSNYNGSYVGGIIGYGGLNLNITHSNVIGNIKGGYYNYTGGIAGYQQGIISNTSFHGNISGNGYMGGIAGNSLGNVKNCSTSGNMTGISGMGGIVGFQSGGQVNITISSMNIVSLNSSNNIYIGGIIGNGNSVYNCINYGNLSTKGAYTAGIGGYMIGKLENNTNYGNIIGNDNTAGICGRSYTASSMLNNINYGYVNCTSNYCGGINGYFQGTTLNNSINYGNVTGSSYQSGISGATNNYIYNVINYGNITGYGNINGIFTAGGYCYNCTNYGNIKATTQSAGGIASVHSQIINNSFNYGNIMCGGNYCGGITGNSGGSTTAKVYNSGNKGNVYGTSYCGGLTGGTMMIISNSYNTGNVSCTTATSAGLIADAGAGYTSCYIENSWSSGFINGSVTRSGGLTSNSSFSICTVVNSYWDINASNRTTSQYGEGLTTIQMKNPSTFNYYDLYITENNINNGYPYLAYEESNNSYVWLQHNNYPQQPLFLLYKENKNAIRTNGSIKYSWGTGYMNMTVLNTNGTVLVNNNIINNISNIYYLTIPYNYSGNYSYNWTTWNISNQNSSSILRNYTVLNSCPDNMVGWGNRSSYCQVFNWTNLNAIKNNLTLNYSLMVDLSSSDADYPNPLNRLSGAHQLDYFSGTFDGRNNTIRNLRMSGSVQDNGLFGYVSTGTVRDLVLQNASVMTTSTNIGAIAGTVSNGNVRNIIVNDSNIKGYSIVGGVVGFVSGTSTGIISNITFNGNVNNTYQGVGGVIGQHSGGVTGATLTYLKSSGIVGCNNPSTNNCYVGGIFGLIGGKVSHVYSNMTLYSNKAYVGGIGGQTGNSFLLNNATFEGNIYITAQTQGIGGIVGDMVAYGMTPTNLFFNGNIYANASYVGGIFGNYQSNSVNQLPVINCSARGTITQINPNTYYVGGIFGISYILSGGNSTASPMRYCYSEVNITNAGNYTGGLSGVQVTGIASNSYSMSNVTGKSFCGGAFGELRNGTIGRNITSLVNVYSAGKVNCTGISVGGLVGLNTTFTNISNSYWDINSSGMTTSASGIGYTTAEMKNISKYNTWSIALSQNNTNNGYPYLAWNDKINTYIWLIPLYVPSAYCWNSITNGYYIPFDTCATNNILDMSKIISEIWG